MAILAGRYLPGWGKQHMIDRSVPGCVQETLRIVPQDFAMTTPSVDGRKRPEAQLLVVEDEPNILELLAASLRYAGFEVISASAGTGPSRLRSATALTSSCWTSCCLTWMASMSSGGC